jgi:hypothetical protein
MRNGPLEIALLLLIGLAGCRGSETENASGGAPASKPGAPAQTKTLTGLYEGGDGPRRNQMCIIEREGRSSSFGFVTWGAGNKNCSGSGTARRENDVLRLSLDGDESCALEARIDGGQVTLPTSIPSECQRYYCGDGAQMGGASFGKVGGEQADAMRAVDLVGDPLCGG